MSTINGYQTTASQQNEAAKRLSLSNSTAKQNPQQAVDRAKTIRTEPSPKFSLAGGSALGHMPAIDALRGLAIILVLAHHFSPAISGNPLTRRFLEMTHTGWVGVDLFFVLSGFLITAILLKTRNSEDFFLNFFARRTLRIFPLYYVTLAVLLIGLPLLLQVPHLGDFVGRIFNKVTRDLPQMLNGQSWLWLYGVNIKVAVEGERWGVVNHFWSLAVEEHFYLVWPLVVYFARTRAALIKVCLVCIIGAPLLRFTLMLAGFDSVVPYVLTPCRVDSLAIGALLSIVISQANGVRDWTRRMHLLAGLSATALAAIVLFYGRYNRDDLLTTFVGYSLVGCLSAWLVLLCAGVKSGTRTARIVANPVLTSLGRYSYGIYLTHMFFAGLFARLFSWSGLHALTGSYLAAIIINIICSIACSWAIAWTIFHVYEKHFLRLKVLFEYKRPAPLRRPVIAPQPMQIRPVSVVPSRRAA